MCFETGQIEKKELEDELLGPADPRKMIEYVDPASNRGKSLFKNTYCAKYPKTAMCYEEGRSADIKHVISHLGYEPRAIVLDLSRHILVYVGNFYKQTTYVLN